MSVVSVRARSFILALFIRDDGERFLLGDRGFDFKDSQLHFSANTIENDEVAKQGVDGVMLAGQVRRASVQSFDGYVGDGTTLKEEVEQMRRDFIAFFANGHHFRVIYIDCNRNAWQRKGGYLVDAPEVKELWQIHPEYHVGLNFEDVNYYEYDENAEGEEILSNIISVPISSDVEGGLVWDENGAVSEPEEIEYDTETATASGTNISISDAVAAPISSFQLKGETSQNGTPTPDAPVAVQTVTGENVVKIRGKNLLKLPDAGTSAGVTYSINSDGTFNIHGTNNSGREILFSIYLDSGEFQSVDYTLGAREALPYGLTCRCEIYRGNTWKRSFVSVNSTRQTQTRTPDFTDANRVRVAITIANGATVNIDNVGIQLEKGSSASSFEPYQEQSYEVNLGDIELCKIGDYQDYIYKSGGKWYVRKEVGKISSYAGETISTNYISTTGSLTTGATVYYALATPTDTEITNEALIAQLEAILSQGYTYAGTNNITTVITAGNEQGELEITYYTKYDAKAVGGGYVWGAGGSGGPTIVTNESISAVSPVWTVFGPALNPMLENTTTGEQIQYVGMISEGQTLVVDMGEQTASLDGLNVISNIVGEYLTLAPGSNTLLFSADSDAPASEIGWSEIVG